MLQVKKRPRVSAAGAVRGCEEPALALGFRGTGVGGGVVPIWRSGLAPLQSRRKTEKLRCVSERGSLKLKAVM